MPPTVPDNMNTQRKDAETRSWPSKVNFKLSVPPRRRVE